MPEDSRRHELGWARVRVALGLAQMAGAAFTAVLLIQAGTSALTLAAAAVTASLMVTSRLLFATRRPNES